MKTVKKREQEWVTDRDRKRVGARFPILLQMEEGLDYWKKNDGLVLFIDREPPVKFRWMAVKRFVPEQGLDASEKLRGFGVLARLDSLVHAGKEVDYALIEKAFSSLVESLLPEQVANDIRKQAKSNVQKWSAMWLGAAATANLESARLVIWLPKTGTPSPAVYCPSREIASYVSLVFSRLFSGVRACLGCGQLFVPGRLDQDYHDRRCADLHRKRRQLWKQQKPETGSAK